MGDNPRGSCYAVWKAWLIGRQLRRSWPACQPPWATASHAGAATCSSGTGPGSAPSWHVTCGWCSGTSSARRRRSR